MGFCEDIVKMAPGKHSERAPKDVAPKSILNPLPAELPGEARDYLTPRVYQRPEPTNFIPTLLRLYQQQPASSKITRKLALTCLQAGQPREALHWFIKTFHLDRSDLSALWNMATLAYRLGEMDAANSYLAEYARLDPYSAWGKIANQFRKTGKFGGVEFSTTFSETPPRTSFSTPGGEKNSGSLLIIDGKTVNSEYISPPPILTEREPEAKKEKKSDSKKVFQETKTHSLNKALIDQDLMDSLHEISKPRKPSTGKSDASQTPPGVASPTAKPIPAESPTPSPASATTGS